MRPLLLFLLHLSQLPSTVGYLVRSPPITQQHTTLCVSMAGFGAKTAAAKNMTPKRQAKAYTRLMGKGAVSIDVYVRSATDGGDWLLVGRLTVATGMGTLMQGAQYQKRLILQHATAISKRLKLARNDLEVGLQTPYSIRTLVKPADTPLELDCGFQPEMSRWLQYADQHGHPLE